MGPRRASTLSASAPIGTGCVLLQGPPSRSGIWKPNPPLMSSAPRSSDLQTSGRTASVLHGQPTARPSLLATQTISSASGRCQSQAAHNHRSASRDLDISQHQELKHESTRDLALSKSNVARFSCNALLSSSQVKIQILISLCPFTEHKRISCDIVLFILMSQRVNDFTIQKIPTILYIQ